MRRLGVLVALIVSGALAVAPSAMADPQWGDHQGGDHQGGQWGDHQGGQWGDHQGGDHQGDHHFGQGFECNEEITGGTYRNVTVPENGVCTLVGTTVTGSVRVLQNGYFGASGGSIKGNVQGDRALTIYTSEGNTVGGNVEADRTAQVFLFEGSVTGNVEALDSIGQGFGRVLVCGMNVGGDVWVHRMGTDILIGDPEGECGANTIGGDLWVTENFTEVELIVRDNAISHDLTVWQNEGPSEKEVQSNSGHEIRCEDNAEPFEGNPNPGFTHHEGQCSA